MIRVNLPHMDAGGLSEGWLFRHSGNLHWRSLCEALDTPSHALVDEQGRRLYPVFVAVRARYDRPLCRVVENEELRSSLRLAHFGRAFYHSLVSVRNPAGAFRLEMITTFASRERVQENDLFRTTPTAVLRHPLRSLRSAPDLLRARQAVHRRAVAEHAVAGHRVPLAAVPGAPRASFEPSPYADFNGVGLLYFAAYPTIVDTVERQLVAGIGLGPAGADWARAASTVARDIFYYRNLNLGERLVVTLNRAERAQGEYVTHSILSREHDGQVVADVVTVKRGTDGAAETVAAQPTEAAGTGACCRARRLRAAAAAEEAAPGRR